MLDDMGGHLNPACPWGTIILKVACVPTTFSQSEAQNAVDIFDKNGDRLMQAETCCFSWLGFAFAFACALILVVCVALLGQVPCMSLCVCVPQGIMLKQLADICLAGHSMAHIQHPASCQP